MVDSQIVTWEIITVVFILVYPVFRYLFARQSVPRNFLRNFSVAAIFSLLLHVQYLVDTGLDFLTSFDQFQFLQIVTLLVYQFYSYPAAYMPWESEPIQSTKPNDEVLQRVQKSLSGNTVRQDEWEEDTKEGYSFRYKNAYQLTYQISLEIDEHKEHMFFSIISVPNRFVQIIHLIALYFATKGFDTSLSFRGMEEIAIPFIGIEVSGITAVLFMLSLSVFLFVVEVQSANSLRLELPLLYKKLLKAMLLDKMKQEANKSIEDKAEDSPTFKSELEKARDKARNILESRQTDVLNKKREQIKNRVGSIFETDTPPLDDETLAQLRLVKAVERILQSTPPWTTVSLKDIAKKAKGDPTEVELIIANLRKNGEVSGIYDIWTQTYSGAKQTQWYITDLLKDLTNSESSIENIKVHPDGSAEISVNKKKSTEKK